MLNYADPRWLKQRKRILLRDNYTCQNINCGMFNPTLGSVQVLTDGNILIHEYVRGFEDSYLISSFNPNMTINIDFFGGKGKLWIALPILQVHHTVYCDAFDLWDYPDDLLITLCKECHTKYHQQKEIDFFDIYGNSNKKQKCLVTDQGTGHPHNFKNWSFVTKNNKEYSAVHRINTEITVTIMNNGNTPNGFTPEETMKKSKQIVDEFFKKYLGAYSYKPNFIG